MRQRIYAEQTARLGAERAEKLKGLVAGYLKQLEELKVELTRAEKIDEAVAVQAEVRRVEGMVAEKPDEGSGGVGIPPDQQPGVAEPGLPKTSRQLEDYLVGTVWRAEDDGKNTPGNFHFNVEGKVGMPWHGMSWEATGKREVRMFTPAWNFTLEFSDDMKAFESWLTRDVKDRRWAGTFERRLEVNDSE